MSATSPALRSIVVGAGDRVRIDLDGAGVAVVALARPDKMNALDPAMFDAINEAIARLRDEPSLRAVVLHGEGRAFCAGLDLSNFAAIATAGAADNGMTGPMADLAARTHGLANRWQHVAWGWRELPVPVFAAMHGTAFGGGLQIALGADLRLAHPETKLSVMEVKWGLVPDMAGCVLLAELMRDDEMRDLVYSGRIVSGEEAKALGLVTRLCDDPLAEAKSLAAQWANKSPSALRAAKRLCAVARSASPADVLLAEAREQQKLLGSREQMETVARGLAKKG